MLSKKYNAIGIDPSPLAIDFCKARGLTNIMQGSGTDLPFPNEHFDLVLLLDVLEHIHDDTKAVQEIVCVLRLGGYVIIFVLAFMLLWGHNDIVSEHVRRYRKKTLTDLFRGNTWHIMRYSGFNTVLFLPVLLVRLLHRFFHIQAHSELNIGSNIFLNGVLFHIFNTERRWLKHGNVPFGVSSLLVAKKTSAS
jgi:SAM-dependent methyltransferase